MRPDLDLNPAIEALDGHRLLISLNASPAIRAHAFSKGLKIIEERS
jgi:hypothetical protein